MICGSCQAWMPFSESWGFFLCHDCEVELEELRLREPQEQLALAPYALLSYQQVARQLILDAKVGRQWISYAFLMKLWREDQHLHELAAWADAIVPAPSSAWSRLYGRFDIAFGLARELGRLSSVPIRPAPWSMHWRWRKQAVRSAKIRRQDLVKMDEPMTEPPKDFDEQRPKLLLVDDIWTSGQTMMRLMKAFPHCEYQIAVLAYAGTQATN